MAVLGKSQEIHLKCFNSEVVEGNIEGWVATITDQLGGIEAAMWAADSRQIMTWSENLLRISIWSLQTSNLQAFISSPKMLPPKGISFSSNSRFAAIAERKEARDVIGIYYAGLEWKMVQTIDVDTFDLQDVMWVNNDSAIMVYDSALDSKILIYGAGTGDLLNKFEPEVIGLGIK